jgi:hypothetical protein
MADDDVALDPNRGLDLRTGLDGRVSTTRVGRDVVATAMAAADADRSNQIAAVRNWRDDYLGPFRDLVSTGARTSDLSYAMADAGLTELHSHAVILREGEQIDAADALREMTAPAFRSVTVQGEVARDPGLTIPMHGARLFGPEVRRQLDVWVANGIVERGFSTALHAVLDNPDWLDLSDTTVVVLGAGAEMGPLRSLLRWGARVIAVDLPRPDVWERVIAVARNSAGRLTIPVPLTSSLPEIAPKDHDQDLARAAGIDIIRQLPELHTWLAQIDSSYILGNYTYADGATHLRLGLATDILAKNILNERADVGLAFLATPTDVYAVSPSTVQESRRRWDSRGVARLFQLPMRAAGQFAPNYASTITTERGEIGIADCLVAVQGPNYALAKRVQRWRATLARRDGRWASLNVAPATRTRSVVKNRALAAAYAGAHRFGVEVFEPATANTVMAALLVHDLRSATSLARADVPLRHPDEAWSLQAAHAGLWTSAYAPRSVLGVAAAMGMLVRS